MAELKTLVHELGRQINANLQFSDEGVCGVIFGEDEISFEMSGNRLFLIAEVGALSESESIYRRLLEANYLGNETGLASISIDSQREAFVLHRVLEGDLDYSSFEEATALFIKALRYWKAWLSAPKDNTVNNPPMDTIDSKDILLC